MTETADPTASETWTVGEVTVTKLVDLAEPVPVEFLHLMLDPDAVESSKGFDWSRPFYLDESDQIAFRVHCFLVETPTKRILVDAGLGDHKERDTELFAHRDTDFMERFRRVCDPATVDLVVSTHLHLDHIGWYTSLDDGTWVPTFPNATYLLVRSEYDHWVAAAQDPSAPSSYAEGRWQVLDVARAIDDSLKPVIDAGLTDWVSTDAHLTPEVRLQATHGHTPGHVTVVVESGGKQAVIAGDVIHGACQAQHPEWPDALDYDREHGSTARGEFLERYADTDTMLLLTHVGPSPACFVRRGGTGFELVPAGGDPDRAAG